VIALLLAALLVAPFSDSFDRVDGPLAAPWQQNNGTWVVSGSAARFASAQSYGYATVPGTSAEADIKLSPTPHRGNAGLTIMWRDAKNHIFCKIENTTGNPNGLMSIGRKSNNAVTSLLAKTMNAGLHNGVTYHVACRRAGDVITMTVSGGDVSVPKTISYTLTSADKAAFGSGVRVGLRSRVYFDEDDGRSTWDNFLAV
jgi:hypothetical protein